VLKDGATGGGSAVAAEKSNWEEVVRLELPIRDIAIGTFAEIPKVLVARTSINLTTPAKRSAEQRTTPVTFSNRCLALSGEFSVDESRGGKRNLYILWLTPLSIDNSRLYATSSSSITRERQGV
jgi:hypothetical protein